MESLNLIDPYGSTSDVNQNRKPVERVFVSNTIYSPTSNSTGYFLSACDKEGRYNCLIITGVFGETSSRLMDAKAAEPKKVKGSILKKIAQLGKNVSEEAWKNVPNDFSSQKNHYLYGLEKK